MRLVVQLAPPPIGYVRVELGRGEVRVAEHLLDAAEIGTAFEQVGREGVAEQVGVDALRVEPCLRRQLAEDQERSGACQRAAAGIQEELGPVPAVEIGAATREVATKRFGGLAPDRDDAFLVA